MPFRGRDITLSPVDGDRLDLVEAWLIDPENSKWLDFGLGRQDVNVPMLKMMIARPHNCLRLISPTSNQTPVGLVGFNDISRFHTANIWYVLGNKEYQRQNLTTSAVSMMLDLGFRQLELKAVQAWTVAGNKASEQVLLKNGFQSAGRFRDAHIIDGVSKDRLLFDVLASDRST